MAPGKTWHLPSKNIKSNFSCTCLQSTSIVEIYSGEEYGFSVDWWALGVLTYEMLAGRPPFNSRDDEELTYKIRKVEPAFKPTQNFTKSSKDFISKLLIKNMESRMMGKAVMEHEFFNSINWDMLSSLKVTPPFVPEKKSDGDISNFEPFYTKKQVRMSVMEMDDDMTEQSDAYLQEFSYYPSSYY